jgi:5-formyltetrahydrofolate cyclo-ligase
MSESIANKRLLRTQLKSTRKRVEPTDYDHWSNQLSNQLIAFIQTTKAREVKGFIPYAGEPNIWPFIHYCWEHSISYIVPKCEQETSKMYWYKLDQQEQLMQGAYSILEPNPEYCIQVLTEPDLVLVPGLAYTKQGERLGYGGGYYDRYYEQANNDVKDWIGIAFDLFILKHIPTEAHDFKCNYIVTNAGVIDCKVEEKGRI